MRHDPEVQFLLRLPLSLRRELKIRATELDTNMNALLLGASQRHVGEAAAGELRDEQAAPGSHDACNHAGLLWYNREVAGEVHNPVHPAQTGEDHEDPRG